jgi:uncharacterized Zn finger protein
MSKIIGLGDKSAQDAVNTAQGQPSVQINPLEQPSLKCSNCGGIFFKQSIILKKISKLLTGNAQDGLYPIGITRCDDCGEVVKESLPDPNMLDNE